MLTYAVRIFKRFAILLPGFAIAYFSVRNIFPYFEKRLPLAVAILATYALAAYVLIPAIIRVIRIIRPPLHLPLYSVTPDGFASDPVNIAVTGSRRELIQAMQAAGWFMADPHTSLRNLIRHGLSTLFNWYYPTAPVSSLYLFGRHQDLAFQKPIPGVAGGNRHHVRFWATTFDDRKKITARSIHWHHASTGNRKDTLLWVGAASLDNGITHIRHNFQITHMIHPDTNAERELIVHDLKAAGYAGRVRYIRLGKPYKLMNRAFRGQLHADGRLALVSLAMSTKKSSPFG